MRPGVDAAEQSEPGRLLRLAIICWFAKTAGRLDRWLDERGHACLADLRGVALSHLRASVSHASLAFSFDVEACSFCRRCVTVCAYNARRLTSEGQMSLNETACRSCGLCASVCPSGALTASFH